MITCYIIKLTYDNLFAKFILYFGVDVGEQEDECRFYYAFLPLMRGKLEVSNNINRFACANCGTEHIVRRGSGIVSLEKVMGDVKQGMNKTASELAIVRLTKEIDEHEKIRQNVVNQYKPTEFLFMGSIFLFFFAFLSMLIGLCFWSSSPNDYRTVSYLIGFGLVLLLVGYIMLRLYKNEVKHKKAYDAKTLPSLDNALKERYDLLAKHKQIISSE